MSVGRRRCDRGGSLSRRNLRPFQNMDPFKSLEAKSSVRIGLQVDFEIIGILASLDESPFLALCVTSAKRRIHLSRRFFLELLRLVRSCLLGGNLLAWNALDQF